MIVEAILEAFRDYAPHEKELPSRGLCPAGGHALTFSVPPSRCSDLLSRLGLVAFGDILCVEISNACNLPRFKGL